MRSMLRKVKEPWQIGYNTDDYTASKVKAAISNDLLYLRSTCYAYGFWVFTSDPITPSAGDQIEEESATLNRNLIVKEKITIVLRKLGSWPTCDLDVLVQFWAPVTAGGRCFLATSNQPFAITQYNDRLCAFRKLSMDYRIYVDMDTTDEKDFCYIGRTFLQKSPRACLDLQCSSNKEIPQRKIKGFFTLPVLEPSSMDCVGVIQILSTAENINWALSYFTRSIRHLLQGVDLTLPDPEVASDQELVEELSDEVIYSSIDKYFESLDTNQMETYLATKSPLGTENLLNGGGMLGLQVAVEDDTINNGNDVISAGKSYFTATDLVKEGEIKTTKREHRQNQPSISYEDLKGHFGMKLRDVVEKLGVSRSTLKRLCRQNGVPRWPSHKRHKVNHPLSDQDPSSRSFVF